MDGLIEGPKPYIESYSSKRIELLRPDPKLINIHDIAHALSIENRFNGATFCPVSVALHSVHVAYNTPSPWKRGALIHDASEAYLKDLPRPMKKALELIGVWQRIEVRLVKPWEHAIREALGMPPETKEEHRAIKYADELVCRAEAECFMRSQGLDWGWSDNDYPDFDIDPLDWRQAEQLFLHLWESLPWS